MCVSYRIREWHCSSVIVQIHSHTLKILFNRKIRPIGQSILIIPHTLDISFKEITSLPWFWCCSYSNTLVLTLFNLHIPAVCSRVKNPLNPKHMNDHQISLDYQEVIVSSSCTSLWSDHQTEREMDLQCLDPESHELMRQNQQLLLFWCSYNYRHPFKTAGTMKSFSRKTINSKMILNVSTVSAIL